MKISAATAGGSGYGGRTGRSSTGTERLHLALKGGDLGTRDWNIRTNEVQYSKRWAEMKGYTMDEIEPHLSTWENLVHPDDLPAVKKILKAHFEGKSEFYEAEFRMGHKS